MKHVAFLAALVLAALAAPALSANDGTKEKSKIKHKASFVSKISFSPPRKARKRTPPPRPAVAEPIDPDASATYNRFHGMYLCSIGSPCPSYAAAFLASKTQLLHNDVTAHRMTRKNTNMESASYHAMGMRGKYDVWRTVDGLDYAVEHLSMYERMIHASKSGATRQAAIGDALYGAFVDRLAAYEKRLREKCGGDAPHRGPRDTDALRTVGVMPLYAEGRAGKDAHAELDPMSGLGSGHTRYESKALYLNITLRSIRCHFGAVAVSALHPLDRAYLEKGEGLPHIDDVLWVPPESLPVNKPPFLGLATVRAMQRRWSNESNALWDQLEYVHYTEADQVLHLRERHRHKLFAPFKRRGGKLAILTPHRLNAVPRAQDVEFLREAFDPPAYGAALPEDPPPELLAERESAAAALRRDRYHLPAGYAPLRDPEFRNVFGNPKRGGFVRRELEGYGAKKVTEVGDDLRGGSCCYLRKGETEYPYDERGKRGGVRVDPSKAGDYESTPFSDNTVDRASPVEILRIGDHGLGILAGLCCHICARRGKLGRHCDNYCTPAAPGAEDCAVGDFADEE